jgi:predicted permease
MIQSKIVFLKIIIMFLVMVVGWFASKRQYLLPVLTKALSVLVVRLTFPALVFVQMLETVNRDALQRGWWIPVFGSASIVLASWIGYGCVRYFKVPPESRNTFIFLVSLPNWVFLPLPIAAGLYGADGVRFVLLVNLGAQITLWLYGVRVIQGGELVKLPPWRMVVTNVGVIATLAGAGLALLWPGIATFSDGSASTVWRLTISGLLGALKMIGDLTIPLSLLVTGALLAELVRVDQFKWCPLVGICLIRLMVAPCVTMLALKAITLLVGVSLTEMELVTATVIVAMPVAISCSMFVEHYNGDRGLSACSIFLTTLLSLVTVPAAVWCCHWLL